jgi:alginate O-acetyltransferase complex protein AlgJ
MTDSVNPSAEALTAKLSPLAGVVMLIFLLSGLASVLWAMFVSDKVALKPPQSLSWEQVFDGEVTHFIAKELANVAFAKQAANLERAASWLTLGDTGSRVREGCPGWLFLRDELKIHPHASSNAAARVSKVSQLSQQLSQRGIELLVVLVPDKSRIAAEQLCGLQRSAQLESRAARWRDEAQAAGVRVLDLAPVLQPLASAAFLRTDSHWSEAGADAAAKAIAQQVAALPVQATPQKQFNSVVTEAKVRLGDLVRLAGLDWLPEGLQPPVERVAATRIVEQASGGSAQLSEDDLFGDSQLPNVAVIGTSFSGNSNFIPFLKRALSASVGNFALDGGEFSGAAKAYFASPAFKQTPAQLLVWEIPERDLQSPYVDDIVIKTP